MPPRPRRLAAVCCAPAALVLALLASPAAAWNPTTQVAIARTGAHIAPPDLARQIEKRTDRFREGVLAPFSEGMPERHYRNRDRGVLDKTLADEVAGAIAALRRPAPFDEIVYRLGRVAHWVADANNPLNAAGDDPAEGRYFTDWLRYADSARPRFAPVFYAGEPVVDSARDLRSLVGRTLRRGRELYPLVGDEYRRIDFSAGADGFDDRSTAFGVAAVSFSHAVSDLAQVLRYVWIAGGGADPRTQLWASPPELLLLPSSQSAGPLTGAPQR